MTLYDGAVEKLDVLKGHLIRVSFKPDDPRYELGGVLDLGDNVVELRSVVGTRREFWWNLPQLIEAPVLDDPVPVGIDQKQAIR